MEEKGTPVNQSAEKLLSIIEYLANQKTPQRLLDMSRELKINTSTLLRFLMTLQKHGYITQDEYSSRYSLTYKLCVLAGRISANMDIRELCIPTMHRISQAFGEAVSLAIEQDRKVVYIEIVDGPDLMLRTTQRIGNVAPMYCTGIGKLFLLNMTGEELTDYVSREKMTRFTDKTITDRDQLAKELEQVRRNGCAYDNEECEIGARCVACPILDGNGRVIAGISVTGPTTRMTDEHIRPKLPMFKEAILDISRKMGYQAELFPERTGD